MQLTSEIGRLYRRYMALNTECRLSVLRLDGAGGDLLGFIEDCVFTRDTLRLRGWTISHSLALEAGGTRHPIPRRVQRGDVLDRKSVV